MLPGCQLRLGIFVLEGGTEVEAAVVNGIYAGFAVMGLPMRYQIFAVTEGEKEGDIGRNGRINNSIVLNTSNEKELQPIYGKFTVNTFKN